jgi:hypothetical protein
MTLESYTQEETDQLTGALLFVGGTSAAGVALLEQLRDNTAELWEFVNHAPVEVAYSLLAVSAQLLAAVSQEIDGHGEAIASALESLAEREGFRSDDADVIELGRE